MQDNRITPEEIGGENFPVASHLLPEKWRQPVLDFYSFLRGMDEIADSPHLKREEKRDQLRVIRIALQEDQPEMLPAWAKPYEARIRRGEFSDIHGEQLWQAFWQDTEKDRYRNFREVLGYCQLSANPVGRAVLEIAGEQLADEASADALCTALQLINHLQDVRSDYLERGRIYLPQDWLQDTGLSEKVLDKAETGPKLRAVFNQWLAEIDPLLEQASQLPRTIRHRGLRWELKIILVWAKALAKQLKHQDPMARRVRLSKSNRFFLSMLAITGFVR
jgi:squalene synthase HpnC